MLISLCLLSAVLGPLYGQSEKHPTLFEIANGLDTNPLIKIETNYRRLIGKKHGEQYQEARFTMTSDEINQDYDFEARIRTRGNMRKKVCLIPPVKIDFEDTDLVEMNLDTVDKLKLVFPCRDRSGDQERLYKEKLLYDIYGLIDSNSIRARLVSIEFIFEGDIKADYTGFLVEDESEYARRKNARIVESGTLRSAVLQRTSFLKMLFFQYMIANTDWSVVNKHNLEMVKLPEHQRVIALPYDFDYAGIVGHSYAVPHESLPIKDVKERYFFEYKLTEGEFEAMVNFYLSLEDQVYRLCDDAIHMKSKSRDECKKFLKSFFDILRKPRSLKRQVVK